MSAKLLKTLASGKCTVKNVISGEVIVYWPNDNGDSAHVVIKPNITLDLLKYASIKQLRKSPNLKKLVNDGALSVVG